MNLLNMINNAQTHEFIARAKNTRIWGVNSTIDNKEIDLSVQKRTLFLEHLQPKSRIWFSM